MTSARGVRDSWSGTSGAQLVSSPIGSEISRSAATTSADGVTLRRVNSA
nr:hypothetical protein [Microlunatus soli]